MEELPKIDLPEEWLIGTGVNKEFIYKLSLSVEIGNIRIMYGWRN